MTPRLRFLLSKAKPGLPLWDIGCDHGFLGEGAFYSGLFSAIHFVDPLKHRIQEASERLREKPNCFFWAELGQNIDEVIRGNVVIAGMGGTSIREILSALSEKGFLTADRLILSPHKDVEEILLFAQDHGPWILVERCVFVERGRDREVFVLDAPTGL